MGLLAGVARHATHFLLLRQKKVSKEKATLLSATRRFATGKLRCSVQPSGPPLLGACRRVGEEKTNTNAGKNPESQQAAMFARERSTRGQMKSPSIAQRGEGGVRGGSGELSPTNQGNPQLQRDAA